jgi:DNA-binding transcriptional ArsR family regulator
MLEFRLDADELARTRFACSITHEVMGSLRVLADPAAHAMHLPWVREIALAVAGLELELLRTLVPATGYVPDFVAPPPVTPFPDLDEELARIRTTPAAEVRTELAWTFPAGVPPALAALQRRPRRGLARLTAQIELYFDAALRDHWARLAGLLQADVIHRAQRLAEHGAHGLFADLHPGVRLHANGRLLVDTAYEAPVALDGRGLLLMPSVFAWPLIRVVTDPPWQPTLIYPARGVATAWEPDATPPPQALARVVGRSRAALLGALVQPRTVGELAAELSLTAGAVSQHVTALRDAGLVAAHRDGRRLLCRRTRLADELIAGSAPARRAR